MSPAEILWVNRLIAMLARVQRVRLTAPVWKKASLRQYSLTVRVGDRGVTAVFEQDLISQAFQGDPPAQSQVTRALAELLRSARSELDPTTQVIPEPKSIATPHQPD